MVNTHHSQSEVDALAMLFNSSTRLVSNVHLDSNTKDTLLVRWNNNEHYLRHLQGYKVRYQAIGSTIVQYSHLLEPNVNVYDIPQLHENTNYNICINVYPVASNETISRHQDCLIGSTSVDSLSVALGSTFGAFLALGIIVFFVFLAKWQHQRKLRKQMHSLDTDDEEDPYDESMEQREELAPMADGEIALSDISLQVNEADDRTLKTRDSDDGIMTVDLQNNSIKPLANGTSTTCSSPTNPDQDSTAQDSKPRQEQIFDGTRPKTKMVRQPSTASSGAGHGGARPKLHKQASSTSSGRDIPYAPYDPHDVGHRHDNHPGGRHKDPPQLIIEQPPPMQDALIEPASPNKGMRHNSSCNW